MPPAQRRNENDIIGRNPPRQDRFDVGTYQDFVQLFAETEDIPISVHDFPNALPQSSTVALGSASAEWLSLTLTGIWGCCGSNHQIYHNGTELVGQVQLDMRYASLIKNMAIEVQGFVRTFVGDELFFLRWKKPMSSGRINEASQCILPFSFTFPEYCTEGPTILKLPPSFNNAEGAASLGPQAIKYRCQVSVPGSSWFQDDVLSITFHYIPRSRPIQLTASREDDLWKPFSNIVRGTLFGQRKVEVTCTLRLMRPLVYARGSEISFMLRLECEDAQALDLLSAPDAISVWLQRNVRTVAPDRYDVVSDISYNCGRKICDARLERQRDISQQNSRFFKGSLPVDDGITPHSFFPSLSVIYSIAVNLHSTGFISSGTSDDPDNYELDLLLFAQLADIPEDTLRDKPVLLVPVGITTDPPDAVLPRWSEPAPPPAYSH